MATRGIDVSHHQGIINWSKVPDEYVFMKCTQGTKFFDPKFEANKAGARNEKMVIGYYHFADGTDPIKEAEWFLKKVGDIREGEMLVLDYELNIPSGVAWSLAFLKYVESKVGFKPLLYTYHGTLLKYDWTPVSSQNFGLWAARYGQQEQTPNPKYKPTTGSWPFYAVWQYCSRGKVPGIVGNVDLNTTDMDMDTLKKYGKPKTAECNHKCPKHCV